MMMQLPGGGCFYQTSQESRACSELYTWKMYDDDAAADDDDDAVILSSLSVLEMLDQTSNNCSAS